MATILGDVREQLYSFAASGRECGHKGADEWNERAVKYVNQALRPHLAGSFENLLVHGDRVKWLDRWAGLITEHDV